MVNIYDLHVAHPEIFKQISVEDKLFLCYQCPQVDKEMTLFTHYNVIVYTLYGKRLIHHREKSWLLTDDKAVFIRKTAYRQEIYDSLIGWQVLVFYFPDEYVCKVFDEYTSGMPMKHDAPPTDVLMEFNVNEIMRAFFYSIVPYFQYQPEKVMHLLEIKFKEMLFSIFSDPRNKDIVDYVNCIRNGDVARLKQVMESNFMFHLSIQEFAQMANCSVSTFKRRFFEHYHVSPGRWLKKMRLDYATALLSKGSKPISEIAYDSGFENVSHFSRLFKETYNMSPSNYRHRQPIA